jgi:undecaprenyl-diphosphatase
MLTALHAIILGIVEGVTEFLPISSTAHLTLAAGFLKIEQTEFMKSFEIIIQLGAILAVVTQYWKRFLDKKMIAKLIVAFIPTGIIGLTLYPIVKGILVGNTAIALWALGIGGVALIILEKFVFSKQVAQESDVKEINYTQCLTLGFFQAIAIIPGVSRSAATIVGGLLMKIPRKTIVEFSFLLAVPTMAAATGLDLIKNASSFDVGQFGTLTIGFIVSFITALLSIRWLLRYVARHDFTAFGIYRLALVAVILFL